MRECFLPPTIWRRLPKHCSNGGRGGLSSVFTSVLTPATIAKMTAPQQPVNGTALRGFGWDIDSPLSTNRGELLPVGSFGHTGFTGTSLWIDPTTQTYIVLMTNAVHMNAIPGHEKGSAVALRTKSGDSGCGSAGAGAVRG